MLFKIISVKGKKLAAKKVRKAISFKTGSAITGRDWDGLISAIENEEKHWAALKFTTIGTIQFTRSTHQNMNYTSLKSAVEKLQSEGQHSSEMEIAQHILPLRPQIMPPKESRVSQLIVRLDKAGQRHTAECVIYAFWVSEGIMQRPDINQYPALSDQYYHGLNLLVSLQTGIATMLDVDLLTAADASKNRFAELEQEGSERADSFSRKLSDIEAEVVNERSSIAAKVARTRRSLFHWQKAARARRIRDTEEWGGKFGAAYDAYVKQLQFEAPIALWSARAKQHEVSAWVNLILFVLLSVAAAVGSIWGFIKYGHTIAASFVRDICQPDGGACSSGFSAEGPLAVTATLFSASLMLWILRLIYRVYLSHRHLALGARERQAFTQAYLAFIKDNVMAPDQVAIVLASLFRPSQDGIVKDDDSGVMDISAASIIAKALAGK